MHNELARRRVVCIGTECGKRVVLSVRNTTPPVLGDSDGILFYGSPVLLSFVEAVEVATNRARIWMRFPKDPLQDRQSSLQVGLGSRVVALAVEQPAQVVEDGGRIRWSFPSTCFEIARACSRYM